MSILQKIKKDFLQLSGEINKHGDKDDPGYFLLHPPKPNKPKRSTDSKKSTHKNKKATTKKAAPKKATSKKAAPKKPLALDKAKNAFQNTKQAPEQDDFLLNPQDIQKPEVTGNKILDRFNEMSYHYQILLFEEHLPKSTTEQSRSWVERHLQHFGDFMVDYNFGEYSNDADLFTGLEHNHDTRKAERALRIRERIYNNPKFRKLTESDLPVTLPPVKSFTTPFLKRDTALLEKFREQKEKGFADDQQKEVIWNLAIRNYHGTTLEEVPTEDFEKYVKLATWINFFIDTWTKTSGDSDSNAIATQIAFTKWMESKNISPSPNNLENLRNYAGKDTFEGGKIRAEKLYPFYELFFDAVYGITQEELKSRTGSNQFVLYRGMSLPKDKSQGFKMGETVKVVSNPLSSWSFNPTTALDFMEFSEHTGDINFVLKQRVPIRNIFSLATTGLGSVDEYEAVVMGVPSSAEVFLSGEFVNDWETLVQNLQDTLEIFNLF